MTDAIEYLSQATLAIAPRYLGYMLSVLQGRAEATAPRAGVPVRGRVVRDLQVVDGIAVVPMIGPVFQRADLFGSFGAVSVNHLRATMGAALEDDSIEGILLVVDSPGGEVAGVADLADDLFAARGKKPMLAVADEGIFSAAYWLASAIGPVVVPRTGGVGSIGALVVHTDASSALDRLGLKMTVIKSGTKKAMFSPFAPLTADARDALQNEVNRVAGFFIDATSRYRGLDAESIRGLEGGTLEGVAAVDGGLADGIDSVEGAFLALRMHLSEGDRARGVRAATDEITIGDSREGVTMSTENPPTAGAVLATSSAPATARPPETVNAPAAPPSAWAAQTNVISIETARRAARDEAQASERTRAAEIMHWCAFAGKADKAEEYIGSAMTLDQVRTDLISITASAGFEDVQTQRSALGSGRRFDSVEEIYERRRMAIRESKQNRRYF